MGGIPVMKNRLKKQGGVPMQYQENQNSHMYEIRPEVLVRPGFSNVRGIFSRGFDPLE
jgi:hypothetical protein